MRLPTICLILLLPLFASAQEGVFPTTDIRSRLMGGTGLTATGIDGIWTNPAGLAGTPDQLQASATAEQRFGISELSFANVAAAYGTKNGGFGLQLASFGFATYRENRIGLAYGRQLTDNFSIGGDLAGFSTTTDGYAATFDITFGLGMQLQILEELAIGARIFSPVRTEVRPDEYLTQIIAVGLSYRPSDKITLNAELHQDADFPARFRAGLEYLPAEELSVRLGVATEVAELSFGLGYEVIERLDISAGAVWHEVLGLWPSVGVRWR
ncbi:hypothetical protein [Lewinella sp. W8]|uniref:hypothetical protein n=1 Tax=Lewinella sp. W8 TaxID=2528208 RepID=UPI0010674A99|nr:hypothetical protein [Lewinella sp. W8]MTB51011.1 hypothetical protein [Lewinella sp. W8]